jgi:hypothetical protein
VPLRLHAGLEKLERWERARRSLHDQSLQAKYL